MSLSRPYSDTERPGDTLSSYLQGDVCVRNTHTYTYTYKYTRTDVI